MLLFPEEQVLEVVVKMDFPVMRIEVINNSHS